MLIISGHRTTLRDWRVADLEAHAYWLQPGHLWKSLDAPYHPGPSAAEIPAIIERQRRRITAHDLPVPRTSLVIADGADELIGLVTWYWESAEFSWPLLGIAIYDPVHWGHGLGYEALGLWTEHLFRELPDTVRLGLRTWSGNHGMIGLAHKLGYRQEACFRKAHLIGGQYYDALGFGTLREEWQECYPRGFAATIG